MNYEHVYGFSPSLAAERGPVDRGGLIEGVSGRRAPALRGIARVQRWDQAAGSGLGLLVLLLMPLRGLEKSEGRAE